jgi:hypothetical protein
MEALALILYLAWNFIVGIFDGIKHWAATPVTKGDLLFYAILGAYAFHSTYIKPLKSVQNRLSTQIDRLNGIN